MGKVVLQIVWEKTGDTDASDDEDLEAYDGFAGEKTAINVEHTDGV